MGRGVRLALLGLVGVLVLALSSVALGDRASKGATPGKILTVNKVGKGTGTVSSRPKGISCGPICSHGFASGATVVLTAKPSVGTRFVGWSRGTCFGRSDCTVTMNAARTATANFKRAWVALKVVKAGRGAGKVFSPTHAIECGSICSRDFGLAATVLLKAKPSAGSRFTGWSGACSGTAPCKLTLTAPTTFVKATFAKNS
jgi:hypothetical protein